MRRSIFILLAFIISTCVVHAQNCQGQNLITVVLQAGYVDYTKSSKPVQRQPYSYGNLLYVYFDGENLIIDKSLEPTYVEISTIEGEIIYSELISENQDCIPLPALSNKIYNIEITREDTIYMGVLNLS